MKNQPFKSLLPLFCAEFIGTAALCFAGLSMVIFNWGSGSILKPLMPGWVLRLISGFLFGTIGCLIGLSRVGKISGAHINPAMSLAFYLQGKMAPGACTGYIVCQMFGAAAGCLPLLYIWGQWGASVKYGMTEVGNAGISVAFLGEILSTICFVIVVFIFVGNKKLRNYTPYTMPFLYCIMVWAEAPLSGTSNNPARSFGPALISYNFQNFWIYIVAPLLGAAIVVLLFKVFRVHRLLHIKSARISFHDAETHPDLQAQQ